jgi:hypothetical protein
MTTLQHALGVDDVNNFQNPHLPLLRDRDEVTQTSIVASGTSIFSVPVTETNPTSDKALSSIV